MSVALNVFELLLTLQEDECLCVDYMAGNTDLLSYLGLAGTGWQSRDRGWARGLQRVDTLQPTLT